MGSLAVMSNVAAFALLVASWSSRVSALHVRSDTREADATETQYCATLKGEIEVWDKAHKDPWADPTYDYLEQGLTTAVASIGQTDVIVASYHNNVSWTSSLRSQGARVTVRPAEGIDEVIAYLRHIIVGYDSNRPLTVFLHGEAPIDWHSPKDLLEMIAKIDATKLDQNLHGYASLNLGHYFAEKQHDLPKFFGPQWKILNYRMNCLWKDKPWVQLLRKRWKFADEQTWDKYAYCCAQFVVSHKAVHGYPKEFYESLLETVSTPQFWPHSSYKVIGRSMEYLWHSIFTGSHENEAQYTWSNFTTLPR